MPGRVLDGFDAAEVHGGLDVGRVAADIRGVDDDRQRHLPGMRADGRRESLLGQQRRADAAGQVAQGLQGLAGAGLELRDEGSFPLLVLTGQGLGQGQPGGDGQKLPLGAVAEVTFDPPSLVVLRGRRAADTRRCRPGQ
jgi:hypothetical protein